MNDLEVVNTLPLIYENISYAVEKEIIINNTKKHSYMIVDLVNDEVIGSVSLNSINQINRTAEIGLIVGNKAYWNKGYGTEAVKLILNYGYNYLNLNNIVLQVYDFNTNAINLYKKIGFKEIGRRRKSVVMNGKEFDIIYMDLLQSDLN